MAKLKLLVVLGVFSLLFLSGICPGWAAIYGVVTEPAYTNPNSTVPAEIPLKFNTTKGLQNFDLKATFDPAKLDYQGYIGSNGNQDDASGFYRVEVYQPPADLNEIRISGMVKDVVTLPAAVTQGSYQTKFLTLQFKARTGTAGEYPTVDITGATDSGNPLSAIPFTQSVVGITEQSYQVNVQVSCDSELPSPYEVKLWGVSATGQAIDQRKTVSDDPNTVNNDVPADTVIEVPAGTYYVMAQSKGYKVDKVARVDTADLKPVSFTFTQLKRRVTLVRRVATNNMLELNFAYAENNGTGIPWDINVPLTLSFYERGSSSLDPNCPSIVFDPNAEQVDGIVIEAGLVITQEVFDEDYISITIDPNVYCIAETSTSYTVAFRVSTENADFNPFDVTCEVDKYAAKMTEKSIGQATSAFKAVEVASVGSVPVKVDFYLTDDAVAKKMESTITVNNIDTNYFVGAGVDPNTLAELDVNLEIEFEPRANDPNSTVVHIRFTDADGLPMEYNPPAEVRAMAGAIEFDIPLHKDLQNRFKYVADNGDQWGGESTSYYNDPNVSDEVLGCLINDQSQIKTKGLYGVYYQGTNDRKPVLFIPQVQYGESLGVWADPDSGLFYAHVVTKHASSWLTQEVIVPKESGDDDEWYECFITLIRPRFLDR